MPQNAMEDSLTLSDLTKLLRRLASTFQAILPAKLQFPITDTSAGPEKKHDLRICDYSKPADQSCHGG